MKKMVEVIFIVIALCCYRFLKMSVSEIVIICLYARLLQKQKWKL
jgi:hypothetical protein